MIDRKPWAIDEASLVTETRRIDENSLPEGPHWDEEGACYVAERCDPATFGCTWRWSARNAKALAKGYQGQPLHDAIIPKGMHHV